MSMFRLCFSGTDALTSRFGGLSHFTRQVSAARTTRVYKIGGYSTCKDMVMTSESREIGLLSLGLSKSIYIQQNLIAYGNVEP